MQLNQILRTAAEHDASDIHLVPGHAPMMRVHTVVVPMDLPPLTDEQIRREFDRITTPSQQQAFERDLALDFSHAVPGLQRYRVNAHLQRTGLALALRSIRSTVPLLEDLNLPEAIDRLVELPRGLVVVTGDTGSGKSTTLAAMINHKNESEYGHILTVEDPIEFVHQSKKCLINQREVHRDTLGFNEALRSALREDPDTILVGELRDLETIRLALTAAETGHLVFGTLHTSSAAKTIDRVVDVFPAEEKDMVRAMLSESLRAVISQTLLKKSGGGRVAAHEIMIGTPAIRNLIRENKIAQMYSAIQTGHQFGMQTLDQCLRELVSKGLVTRQEAAMKAANKDAF